jgi:hypothetical protein
VVIGVLLCCGGLARAELITIAISGQVTKVSDKYNRFGGQISVGTPITGTYTYDSATLDSNPSLTVGDYRNYNSSTGISLYIGEYAFKTNPASVNFLVEVCNNQPLGSDSYLLHSQNNLPLSDGTPVQYIRWQLDDPTGTILSSDALPLTSPDLSKWQSWFGLSIGTDRNFGITATITSATPEPATAFLFGLGLILARKKLRR